MAVWKDPAACGLFIGPLTAQGDFNRDGTPDFLWQHDTNGEAYV